MVGFVKEEGHRYAGKHLLVDFYGCRGDISVENILSVAQDACRAAGATILFAHGHPFPDCVSSSGVIVLAESHLTWHVWEEENNFIAFDIFMCGDCEPRDALPVLEGAFEPEFVAVKEEKRGQIDILPEYNI